MPETSRTPHDAASEPQRQGARVSGHRVHEDGMSEDRCSVSWQTKLLSTLWFEISTASSEGSSTAAPRRRISCLDGLFAGRIALVFSPDLKFHPRSFS